MNTTLTDPWRRTPISSKEENEMREIFYQHWKKMKNQMKTSIDVINLWRSQSIQEINSHANEQVRIFQADFKLQRGIFDKKREDSLNIAKAYHQAKQNDLFKELYNECQLLEFQVAQLEYIRNENERPNVVIAEEQTRRKKQDKTNTHVYAFEDYRTEPIIEDANVMEKNGGNISRSSVNSKSNDTGQWSVITSSSNVNDKSTSNKNNSKANTANGDDSINKCPVCFMIFPSHMTKNDRQEHVYEHMIDD